MFSYADYVFFKHNSHKKRKEVCIKARSTSASRSLKGWDTEPTTVKWSIGIHKRNYLSFSVLSTYVLRSAQKVTIKQT